MPPADCFRDRCPVLPYRLTLYNPIMPNLESLARESFGELTAAERILVTVAPTGAFAVCGPSDRDSDPANQPGNAASWGNDRKIRANLIRWMCFDVNLSKLVDPKGIQIFGAKVEGTLDLSQVRIPFPIALLRCRLTQQMLLRATEVPFLALDGSWVTAVEADGVEIKGGVTLRSGFRSEQKVRLRRARIGRDFDCGGGTFIYSSQDGETWDGIALGADGATFGAGVFLNRGFSAVGQVRLPRVHIQGDLDCSRSTIKSDDSPQAVDPGVAFNADGINVGNAVFLRGARAEGEIRFPQSKIGGDFDCGAAVIANPYASTVGHGKVLNLEGSAVGGSVVLNDGFKAIGVVSLRAAKISGQLNCFRGTFENHETFGAALDASLANIATGVFLGSQFRAEGDVRLQNAQIGLRLECSGGTFSNPPDRKSERNGSAIALDGANVTGNVIFGNGFRAEGEVCLVGTQVQGNLDCSGGTFINPPIDGMPTSNRALSAHALSANGNVFMRGGFISDGEVSFSGASIAQNLEVTSAEFRGELNLEAAAIKGALMLSNISDPESFQLTLTNASVGALADEKESWPQPRNLILDGFEYGRFAGPAPRDSKARLNWLHLQQPFMSQPYRQLSKVLTEEGENAASMEVLFELESQVRARDCRLWQRYFVNPALRSTIGYGYYPLKAFRWLAIFILVGFVLFGIGYRAGSMTPTDKDAYVTFTSGRQIPAYYQRFYPLIYSVENSLPFVKLGQVDRWQPDPDSKSVAWRVPASPILVPISFAGVLRCYQWLQILSGWILGTLFIAGVTGVVRKN